MNHAIVVICLLIGENFERAQIPGKGMLLVPWLGGMQSSEHGSDPASEAYDGIPLLALLFLPHE